MKKIGSAFIKVLNGKFFMSLLAAFFVTVSALATVNVESTVDRNEMGPGDTFELRVVVSYSDAKDIGEPSITAIPGFDILNSGTSSSTSSKLVQTPTGMQFETQRAQEYVYQLAPKNTGVLTVPSFKVVVDGKTFSTKPIQIRVDKSVVAQKPNRRGNRHLNPPGFPGGNFANPDELMDEADELFNQLLKRRGGLQQGDQADIKNPPKNPNEAFSVQLELDKTNVYEGEQIVANWYIYTRGNILSLDRLKFPDLKGFWKEIIEEVPALNFTQEVVNGIPYRRALLASHALFPIKSGAVVVDEFKIRASVALPSSPFGSFGMGQPYTYSRSSERVKINVKPLPVEGKPSDFSGAVGQFDVQASVSEGNQFPVNQPFALKIRFEGAGNAKLIELPSLNLPSQLEVYNTKNESKFFKNGRSFKEFEILLIPRQEGELTIPAFGLSMFDPATGKYVSRKTEAIKIKVLPGSGNQVASAARIGDAKATAADPKKEPTLPEVLTSFESEAYALPTSAPGFWAGIFGLILVVLGFKARAEFGLLEKQRNIRVEFEKRMKKVHSISDKGDWRAAAVEMTNTIYFVLGEVSGQGGANLEIQKLLDLAPPSVRRDLGVEFQKYIEIFQVLSFAPESVVGKLKDSVEFKKSIQDAKSLLEKAMKIADKEAI